MSSLTELNHKLPPSLRAELRNRQIDVAHISPHESQRYNPRGIHSRYDGEKIIPRYTLNFKHSPILPDGWVQFVHPDGYPYYFNAARNTLTDINLLDSAIRHQVEATADAILAFQHEFYGTPTIKFHLVLENYVNSSGKAKIGYYLVNVCDEGLFWLDDYDSSDIDNNVKIDSTMDHLETLLHSQYWFHCEAYPHVYSIPDHALSQLRDLLIHAIGDSITSCSNTTSMDVKQLKEMLDLVNNMQLSSDSPNKFTGSARMIYRFLGRFERERFRNLYGQPGARLSPENSIFKGNSKRTASLFLRLLSPLFFDGPRELLFQFEEMIVDNFINVKSWDKLCGQLIADWTQQTLYSTVLLNANVAFLAIQSVDLSVHSLPRHFSYASITASILSIVMGLLLYRQHRGLDMRFLANWSESDFALETLALLYVLPYVCLMWGMITFFAAFLSMCFLKENPVTTVMMAIGLGLGLFFIIWCRLTQSRNRPYWYTWYVTAPKHSPAGWLGYMCLGREKSKKEEGHSA